MQLLGGADARSWSFVAVAIVDWPLPAAATARDLTIGISQFPSNLNPNIDSMAAKSYVLGLTQRPFTTYDQRWELVCMLCTELPTLENGKAVAERRPAASRAWRSPTRSARMPPGATARPSPPVTFSSPGRSVATPKSGVGNAEMYRRFWQLDLIDDKTFTLHDEKLGFNYNAINDFRLLPEHLERPVFEADPATYRNRTLFDTDPTNPGLAFGPYRIARIAPGSQILLERNPTWWGEQPAFDRIVDQGDREHHGTRGQSALGRGRDGRGLASACRSTRPWPSSVGMATGSRSSTSRAWSTSIWT